MKEHYNIKIADIQLSILSDEPRPFVESTVAQLDRIISDLTIKNKRCSKMDAAILCALDALSEKNKNEKKLKNLEAQLSLCEASVRRLKEELLAAKKALEEAEASAKKAPVQDAPAAEKNSAKEAEQLSLTDTASPEEEKTGSLHDHKLRQIEELLRRRTEDSTASAAAEQPVSARDAKLREIEDLLRSNGGSKTLTEALHDAIEN